MTRRLEWVEGPATAIVAKAVELIGDVPGAASFELSYEAADRILGDDEEPRPDEAVVWTAAAELTRRYPGIRKPVVRTVTGTAFVEPGQGHAQGIVDAVVDLLRKLGANVAVFTAGGEE